MNTRKNRVKRVKLSDDFVPDYDEVSVSSFNDPDELEAVRKSRIRDSNKEFARRMTILQSWSQYWSDYTKREGEAYPLPEAKSIMKRAKKITCPIPSCRKAFTSIGGLRYHYARCNIEQSFNCLVCNPPMSVTTRGELLRHMILNHCQELPSLNAEQQQIANSYFSCQNRLDKNKKDRKVNTESESPCNSQRLVECFQELLISIYSSQAFVNRPYKDWKISVRDWELINHMIEKRRFQPPENESVDVKFPTSSEKTNLKTGESKVLDYDKRNIPRSFLFYTGGINTAVAWLPKSPYDKEYVESPDLLAVSVNCCSMDQSYSFKESHHTEGCIQFWTLENSHIKKNAFEPTSQEVKEPKINLSYLIAHTYGTIFDMAWCPLGCSWQPNVDSVDHFPAVGLLALACGDGQIRILGVPHSDRLLSTVTAKRDDTIFESTPMFRVKPIAKLMPPGVGPSTDYQQMSCKSVSWSINNGQRYLAAGYVNGNIALFDLSNTSPILYMSIENRHVYQPLRTWFAHGGPVTSVAFSSAFGENSFICSGSIDRQLKISNPMDLNSCIVTDRAPINRVSWDFRFRGVMSATDTAFTSFNNKVSYRYPVSDGNYSITISSHRASVYGLASSIITSSVATSDQAGEVFVLPQLMNRQSHRRDRNLLSVHSLFTMIPFSLKGKSLEQAHDVEEDGLEANADFSHVERTIANMPDKFLLPIEHRPVTTYNSFKKNFGLQFRQYDCTQVKSDSKMPDSCIRAMDMKDIYCDRPCDYPFSSINQVTWSPNFGTFPYLFSASQVGLCRLDRVSIIEQVFGPYIKFPIPSSLIFDTEAQKIGHGSGNN